MEYPDVTLLYPVEVQPPVNVDVMSVIQIAENPSEETVNAFISTGTGQIWVSILTPETYKTDWTDADVISAIQKWASETYPKAK